MTYYGYLRYDGIEITNEARLQAYVDALGLEFYVCKQMCEPLNSGLEMKGWKKPGYDYTDPLTDNAPWIDRSVPYSHLFAGVSLLGATNMGHTTHSAETEELARDGAYVRVGRRSSREMVFRALLLGANVLACRYGLIWLTSTLMGGNVCRGLENPYLDYADIRHNLVRYKVDDATPSGDNVYQLNWFTNIATGPTAPEGNTYKAFGASMSSLTQEHAEPPLERLLSLRECMGYRMDFAPACLDPFDPIEGWRFMVDVSLMDGPRVLSEHTVGGGEESSSCSSGAWMEVEFTLVAANPGIWREPQDLVTGVTGLDYDWMASLWLYYRGGAQPPIDDDMYTSPLVYEVQHTYDGVGTVLSIKMENAGGQPGLDVPSIGPLPLPSPPVVDPLCPTVPGFPAIPQASIVCGAPYTGPYASSVYQFDREILPRFYPLSFIFVVRTYSKDVRDVRLLVIPTRIGSQPLEIVLTYLPKDSYFVIDSIHRRTDILQGASTNAIQWVSASNLIGTGTTGVPFKYQEVVCPSDFIWEVDVPTAYAPEDVDVLLRASVRDV